MNDILTIFLNYANVFLDIKVIGNITIFNILYYLIIIKGIHTIFNILMVKKG